MNSIKTYSKESKIAHFNQILYGQRNDDQNQYLTKLHIISKLSEFNQTTIGPILMTYFHSWYLNSDKSVGEIHEDEFIYQQVLHLLSLQSNDYVMSMNHLIDPVNVNKTYLQKLGCAIGHCCIDKKANESYHDVVKKIMNLTANMENIVLNQCAPIHLHFWSVDQLDGLFKGLVPKLPSDLISSDLSDSQIDQLLEAIIGVIDKSNQ